MLPVAAARDGASARVLPAVPRRLTALAETCSTTSATPLHHAWCPPEAAHRPTGPSRGDRGVDRAADCRPARATGAVRRHPLARRP